MSRFFKQQDATGSVTLRRKGNCGRKRKTTPKDDLILLRNSKKDPRNTSFDLQKDLASVGVRGVRISSSTVRHRLLEAGRNDKKPLKKHLLTKRMKKKRLHWAKTQNLDHKRLEESSVYGRESFFRSRKAQPICQHQQG